MYCWPSNVCPQLFCPQIFALNCLPSTKLFFALQVISVFIILGIGADDVFIYIDALKQSACELPAGTGLEERMNWAYSRYCNLSLTLSLSLCLHVQTNTATPTSHSAHYHTNL